MGFKKIIGTLLLSAVIIAVMVLLPLTIGLGKAGFESQEIVNQFNFYQNIAYFLIGILILVFVNYLIKKNNKEYGDSLGFFSIGEKPALGFFKRFTAVQLPWLTLIIFSTLFLIANVSKIFIKSLTGLHVLPQQFSATDSVVFSGGLIPASENLLAGFVIAFIAVMLGLLAVKRHMKPNTFKTLYYSIPVVVGLLAIIWHSWIYPNSEISLFIVFIFWTIGALVTLLIGYFAVFWVIHFLNNFFIDISRFLSSELILIWIGLAIFVLILLYGIVYRGRLLGKKPTTEE